MLLDILVGSVVMVCLLISSIALLPPPARHGRGHGHHRASFHFHWPHFHWPHFHLPHRHG
ncbi:hypothetical protein FB565_000907 [Actinoplanes lutulentus]|uniref:Uncharacterized protein n=1 Tax=Actinoplanes lutulentus TaxID=1287878 RepID=A0A327ZL52_9ACTN|nr:hypothetical protein [Actinoplanes lutulentus]MBB2941203.1 hypothetical protein [Actinoplanes lutulentus]RAK43512.1 hypothetical protein B0I29_101642 [Actinoplanes lutulentus]